MTYRRLFTSLCLAGLCMLAGAWWMSLRYYSVVGISPHGGDASAEFALFSGSLGIELNPYDPGPMLRTFVSPVDKLVRPKFVKDDPMGNLDRKKMLVSGAGKTAIYRYQVRLPLWMIYLAFVAVAYFALRRWMGKQRRLEREGGL